MSALIFILVLVVLILVHEAGHFFAAKAVGMRVDEFGIGYPPRVLVLGKRGGTEYTLNWLPFGGFVRIFGEDGEVQEKEKKEHKRAAGRAGRAFTDKSRLAQAFVLVAGITMNFVLAWVLLTGALMAGTPRALAPEEISRARDVSLAVGEVLPDSPAARAGLEPGDLITSARVGNAVWQGTDPTAFTSFVAADKGAPIELSITRNGAAQTLTATPEQNIVPADVSRFALGVGVSTIGTLSLSFGAAVNEGTAITWELIRATAVGLGQFFAHAVTLTANLSQVSGPIGIASAVGSAASQGAGNLLSLVALISINLALINLIPIPALDGGRLLFVLIEAVSRRAIKPSVARAMNTVGFVLIILLMVVVTAHDIFRIVG